MARFQEHLRSKFLAGVFAAIPIAITAFVVWTAEKTTRELLGVPFPFLGVVAALAGIYLLGVIVSSLLGRYFLRAIDRLLSRIPVLAELYRAWKQVTLTPGGTEGMFAKVVLIPVEGGELRCLGFTSGLPIEGDAQTCCVFVPGAPNPTNGRLYFVPRADCHFLGVTTEEAFKFILSGGNYVPPAVGKTTAVESVVSECVPPSKL